RSTATHVLQEIAHRVEPARGHLQHPLQQLSGQTSGELAQVAEQLAGRVRVRQGAVRMRMAQAQLPREMGQAVAGSHGKEDARQLEGVEELIDGSLPAVQEEGQVE